MLEFHFIKFSVIPLPVEITRVVVCSPDPKDDSRMTASDPAREKPLDGESSEGILYHELHNIAAHLYMTIIGRLASGTVLSCTLVNIPDPCQLDHVAEDEMEKTKQKSTKIFNFN